MGADDEILDRIKQNNAKGQEMVRFIEQQLPQLKKAAIERHHQKLEVELQEKNAQLKSELAYWMDRVAELERMMGIPQYSLSRDGGQPSNKPEATVNMDKSAEEKAPTSKVHDEKSHSSSKEKKSETTQQKQPENTQQKQPSKKEKGTKVEKKSQQPLVDEKQVDVSRLDLRVGLILSAEKHPEADSLYVEQVDVGEAKPRNVVSGLVKFVPLERMQRRPVVVLCNLKPAKMRGVTSEAMVMCASTPEAVEILAPPEGAVPGDRVSCEEFEGEPDALLNPKKKIFEQVAPDLKTNSDCVATYKGKVLRVVGKGAVKADSLINVQIK